MILAKILSKHYLPNPMTNHLFMDLVNGNVARQLVAAIE